MLSANNYNWKLTSDTYFVHFSHILLFTVVKACLATVACLAARAHGMPAFAVSRVRVFLGASTTRIARRFCKAVITTSELRASRFSGGNPRCRSVMALFTVCMRIWMVAAAKSVFLDGVAAAGIVLLYFATRHAGCTDSETFDERFDRGMPVGTV